MGGLCGIAFGDNRATVGQSTVRHMINALEFQGARDAHMLCSGPIGLGVGTSKNENGSVAELMLRGSPVGVALFGNLYEVAWEANHNHNSDGVARYVLERYLKEGLSILGKFRGDFVLGVWDGRDGAIHIVTDRFRVHPVFYYEGHDKIVFASRMKSLLACPFPVPRTINPLSLVDVMAFSVITTERTVFKEVKKLPPGHILTYRDGKVVVRQYWDIDFLNPDGASGTTLTQRLKEEFNDAVSARLAADADRTVGAFLSGGIDSSTVTGVLTKLTKGPVKCFSIGFGEERFNEMEFARIAARHFGAEHHEYYVTPQDTFDAMPKLMASFDEPFANASAIPTYFCAKLARDHDVDVMYAGDGGDELFAGNERYGSQRVFDYYNRLPKRLREWGVKPIVTALADLTEMKPFVLGKKYIRRASIPLPERLYSYGLFNILPMDQLLGPDIVRAVGEGYDPCTPMRDHYLHAHAATDLDRYLYVDLKITISDNDLLKVTRMTQAAGVAVRFPFLDHKLAEFAARVPAKVKMPGRELRVFFKRAYSDLLPEAILRKTKHGFGLPIPVWLRTDKRLNDMMHELVLGTRTVQRGLFNKAALEELVNRHRTEVGSFYGDVLWNVMVWELWLRTFWDGQPAG